MDKHRPILLTSPEGTNSIINNATVLSVEDPHGNNSSPHDDPPSPKSSDSHHYLDTPLNNHNSSLGVQFDAEQLQRGRSRIKRRNDNVSRTRDTIDANGDPLNNATAAASFSFSSSSSSNATTTAATGTTSTANSNQSSRRGSRSESRSFSRSRSRSRSRTASRIRDEEYLKWTVLRQDPSMRLHNYKVKYSNTDTNTSSKKKKNKNNNEDEDEDEDEDTDEEEAFDDTDDDTENEDEEEEEEEEEDTDEEESDEEQVSDIENDNSINEQFNYDLGTKVLPNFCSSINYILESSKPWIDRYESENPNHNDPNINISALEGGYIRGVLTLNKRGPLNSNNNATTITTTVAATSNINSETIENENINDDSYILYVDLTSESIYAVTYVMGTLVKNGDTIYIVHWHSDSRDDFVKKEDIVENIIKLRNHVLHLFDCISATVDNLDVIILSLTHPYPKHLLNEMINGLQPLALCCSLSMTLSGLQNFICSVPTFIIRKKLKRAKKKGIFD